MFPVKRTTPSTAPLPAPRLHYICVHAFVRNSPTTAREPLMGRSGATSSSCDTSTCSVLGENPQASLSFHRAAKHPALLPNKTPPRCQFNCIYFLPSPSDALFRAKNNSNHAQFRPRQALPRLVHKHTNSVLFLFLNSAHLETTLQAAAEGIELLDVGPVGHREAAVLQAHHLLRGLVLPDRREQLPERPALLLLGLSAQLHSRASV